MSKHTKGQWELGESLRGGSYTAINGEGWDELATVVTRMRSSTEDSAEGLANARLIVAAPELLSALEVLMGLIEITGPRNIADYKLPIAAARAAISRAKGN